MKGGAGKRRFVLGVGGVGGIVCLRRFRVCLVVFWGCGVFYPLLACLVFLRAPFLIEIHPIPAAYHRRHLAKRALGHE